MRVLFLALGCAARADRAEAALDTWARELPEGDRLVFMGDAPLAERLGAERVWECVQAGGPDDNYTGLPRKVLAGLRRARALADWDVVAKLDDDTLVRPRRVHALLRHHLDLRRPLYLGGTGFHDRTSSRWIAGRGLPLLDFFYFAGGGAYFLTRPALEQGWEALAQVMDAHGVEDGYLGAALAHAGVPVRSLPHFFRHHREPERLIWSCAATICELTAHDLRVVHRHCLEELPTPFDVVEAEVGFGMPGLGGLCGYDELAVVVGGEPRRRALSAHAPSRLVLRSAPGLALRLRGALNDSVEAGHPAVASFSVLAADGAPLAALGEARAGAPTREVRVVFPPDGVLQLRIACPARPRCHSVWLWEEGR